MAIVDLGSPRIGALPTTTDHTATADRPALPGLIDRFGRVATDLRVSVTDRCNLRCDYCMPAEGLDWLPRQELLTDDEIVRLIRIGTERLGIDEVRYTGGEPLVRKGLVDIVRRVTRLRRPPMQSMTTNGIGLARMANTLRQAGLDRVNVSMDTVDPDTFAAITRRPRLPDVLAGLRAAAAAGLTPVKVNAVLQRGVNDRQAPDLLAYCLDCGYQLRIIEQMPLDAQHGWRRDRMVTAADVFAVLADRFRLRPHPGARGGAPAELFDVLDGAGAVLGTVGIIASVTRPFCGDCDRTRLTADGQLRNCLFARTETDLRALLRSGCSDEALATAWRSAMWSKAPGHGIDDPSFLQPDRPMSAIGG